MTERPQQGRSGKQSVLMPLVYRCDDGVSAARGGDAVLFLCGRRSRGATREFRMRKPLGICWYFSCQSPKLPPTIRMSLESRLAREIHLRLSIVGIGSTRTDDFHINLSLSSESTMR
jgi:hypothetical protein